MCVECTEVQRLLLLAGVLSRYHHCEGLVDGLPHVLLALKNTLGHGRLYFGVALRRHLSPKGTMDPGSGKCC